MRYRFDGFEVDTQNREVERDGCVRPLQPQAFALLAFLIRHRDRVVSKAELLAELWPDAVVGEGSIQRAVHLARVALDDDGTRIRTVPKLGYRFIATVEEVRDREPRRAPAFSPRFVQCNDGVHIAYHTFGEGSLDIVLVPGWVFPMRAFVEHPGLAPLLQGLTARGRVITFDKRGTGLSDRIKELPTLERRMDDLRAVLDAVGSRQAVLVGFSEGGPLCILHATSFPERTRGLLLVGSFARWGEAPGYAAGWSHDTIAALRAYIGGSWGSGETIRAIVESRANDPETIAWAARAEQEGASPGAALDLLEMNLQIDVRPLLGAVSVPVVVLHHTRDAVIGVDNGRYLAEHVSGAELLEVDGRDHAFLFEGRDKLFEALDRLAQRPAGEGRCERFLTTVLVVCAQGGARPDELDRVVSSFRGASAGATLAWVFDGPQRAIACGHALVDLWRALDESIGVGVHTGEVERRGATLVGEGVQTAALIAGAALPGEVRVSRVVRDLVHGSTLEFETPREIVVDDGRVVVTLASKP